MRGVFSSLTSLAVVAGLSGALVAQQPPAAQPTAPAAVAVKAEPSRQAPAAVKVDIVLSRTNGSKTLSSLPYSLSAAEGRRTSLRLGSQVPIPVGGGGMVQYQNVGSSIDCDVTVLADGRYRLGLTIDDSSLAEGTSPSGPDSPPVIRSYRIDTMLVLRNGEATTFNVATDKVSGDTITAKVTVTALK